MAIINTMLNIMPYNCRYCIQGFKGMEHISTEARINNINLIELQKTDAEKDKVWETLAAVDPIFVNGFGHGNADVFTGDSERVIFQTSECGILAGRIVYLLSCMTAQRLGPAIIEAGGLAYGGYFISWTWMTETGTATDPYTDRFAEAFYRSSNEFPIAIIQGEIVAMAQERCIAEYNRWIEIWETEKAGEPGSAEVIKWMLFDRDGLTVLGNLFASIGPVGILTSLQVDTEPPRYAHVNDQVIIRGKLLEEETQNPLSGKVVKLLQWGVSEPLNEVVTSSDGTWRLGTILSKGTQTIYALFAGDDTYGAAFSDRFEVGIGIVELTVSTTPASTAEVGDTFLFSGTLIDKKTNEGLPDKTIEVSLSGEQVTTDSDGRWSALITFNSMGRYILSASFEGDSEFIGITTEEYHISVGVLPAFGLFTIGDIMRSCVQRITGTVYRCPNDGTAESLNIYGQFGTVESPCIMRGALYRRSDMKLLGITEEKTYQHGINRRRGWERFTFINKPSLVGGEDYILVGLASNGVVMYYKWQTERHDGVEVNLMNDFPEYLIPDRWRDTDFSISCEYSIKETEEEMAVTFAGTVSVQATTGEEVTITVTLPDGSTEQVVALTGADKSFSTGYSNEPGNYSAKARVEEDALYQAAESADVPFAIGKQPRTITLTVA